MLRNVPGFSYVTSSHGVDEYRLLSNDLQVLLYKDTTAPVAMVNVTYRVGSRNEVLGTTGSTHILEHMLFKGSKNFNKKLGKGIWNLLESKGAVLNATTWLDRTNYWELFPKELLDDALAIEADRMRGALIKEEDLTTEMTVVRNEYERGENQSIEALDKMIWAAAYQAHPYHHSTIGWKSDIEQVTAEKLKQFYDTFYWPNNATLIVAGDFDEATLLADIKKYFGAVPKSSHTIPEVTVEEPPQEGERRVVVSRAGELPVVGVAYRIPEGLHADFYAINVLMTVLGQGTTSRLHAALVDTGLATDVSVFAHPLHDPGLFLIFASVAEGADPIAVEKVILEACDRIAQKGITDEELTRAQVNARVDYAWHRDGVRGMVSYLNESIAMGDWKFYTTFLLKLEKVTKADVKRVAETYCKEMYRTVGHFIPKKAVSKNKKQRV